MFYSLFISVLVNTASVLILFLTYLILATLVNFSVDRNSTVIPFLYFIFIYIYIYIYTHTHKGH